MSKNVGKALNKESDFCCLLADTVYNKKRDTSDDLER